MRMGMQIPANPSSIVRLSGAEWVGWPGHPYKIQFLQAIIARLWPDLANWNARLVPRSCKIGPQVVKVPGNSAYNWGMEGLSGGLF